MLNHILIIKYCTASLFACFALCILYNIYQADVANKKCAFVRDWQRKGNCNYALKDMFIVDDMIYYEYLVTLPKNPKFQGHFNTRCPEDGHCLYHDLKHSNVCFAKKFNDTWLVDYKDPTTRIYTFDLRDMPYNKHRYKPTLHCNWWRFILFGIIAAFVIGWVIALIIWPAEPHADLDLQECDTSLNERRAELPNDLSYALDVEQLNNYVPQPIEKKAQ